jgi:nicotinate-nucleotide adenylyltransferase
MELTGLTGRAGADQGRPWGILGGTFDPIHLGHLAIAEQTHETLDLAGVLFLPASQSPHKAAGPASPAALRAEMVELAVAGNAAFRVSRMELERPAPSYTVDTLEALHAEGRLAGGGLPDPWLILSVETLAGLVDWHRPERLLELCRIAVVPRRGYPAPRDGWIEERFPGRADRFRLLDGPDLGHSASVIRARVAAGRSIRYLVPDAVARCIVTHGLYGARADDGGR